MTEDNTHSFKEHFIELRNRLIYVCIFFMVAFACGYLFSADIYRFLLKPLHNYYATTNQNGNIIYTSLTEAFFSYIKLASYFAIFCTLPFFLVNVYIFIAPALKKKEKNILIPYLISAPILFVFGAIIAYELVFPAAWKFLLSFETHGITSSIVSSGAQQTNLPIKLEARISEYLSLSVQIIIAFGIAFQMPIVLTLLNRFDIVSIESLRSNRRGAIVVIFIASAVITPPDVMSQLILAAVLIALYECSILGCSFLKKNKLQEEP